MKTHITFTLIGLIGIGLLMAPEAFARNGAGHARAPGAGHARAQGQGHAAAAGRSKTADPGVNARQHRQHERTEQGVRSGQLTKGETKEIAKEQQAIRKEERQYKSDGTLTKEERKDLHQDQNAASKNIYQEKHDAETRPGVTPAEPGEPGTRDPGVNARQHHQKDRIGQGVKSGQLTKEETKELAGTQQEIRQEEKAYKSDGTLTAEERKDLHQDLNAASKEIYSEKHDADTRAGTAASTAGAPSSTGGSSVAAGTRDPGVNARQENQQDRIAQGVKSGELTKKETQVLAHKEARVAALEKKLKEDGTLTASERAKLQKQMDVLSKDIYRQKHDNQEQPTAQ